MTPTLFNSTISILESLMDLEIIRIEKMGCIFRVRQRVYYVDKTFFSKTTYLIHVYLKFYYFKIKVIEGAWHRK